MFRKFLVIAVVCSMYSRLDAQDSLPNFIAENIGKNRVRIGWINPFGEGCNQLNVQRSYDSLRNFRTIFSTQSPELPQNGFIDTKFGSDQMYYRIFYVLNGGAYYFTLSKKPTTGIVNDMVIEKKAEQKIITIKLKDAIYRQITFSQYQLFRDSVLTKTKDSLIALSGDLVLLKPFVPPVIAPAGWVPSHYIFTGKAGDIIINIPDAKEKKYSIIFYDNDNKELFTIRHLKDAELMVDKENFLHGGWFGFSIYEEGKLVEKNKFFLQKEF